MKTALLTAALLTLPISAFAQPASVASVPTPASVLEGFGPSGACQTCQSAEKFRKSVSAPIPEHAIVLDFGNGPFWRNSKLTIVDLDAGQALTYRFPPEEAEPTQLRLMGRRPLTGDQRQDLIRKAQVVWNPPPNPQPPSLLIKTDFFETIYVVNGAVMEEWISFGDGPAWYTALTDAVRAAAAPQK